MKEKVYFVMMLFNVVIILLLDKTKKKILLVDDYNIKNAMKWLLILLAIMYTSLFLGLGLSIYL